MVSNQPAYVCVGSIIIDDIVFPNGDTRMEVLGGGAVHAAAGMRVWDQRPGLVACAGRDLPDAVRARLKRECDVQGIVWLDVPQLRAWQVFEWDGRRTEIFRVDVLDQYLDKPLPDSVPAAYHGAKGVHLVRGPDMADWRALYPHATLLWEPMQPFMIRENQAPFRSALPLVDIVSPNWLEAQQVYGFDDPARLVRAMLDDGASIAVLRMGEAGSLAGQRGRDDLITVPAVPVPQIMDQTGAGNTYCGGFLVGWLETHDLRRAACYGAVAASFALEVIGVADLPANLADVRRERFDRLMQDLATQHV